MVDSSLRLLFCNYPAFIRLSYTKFDGNLLSAETKDGNDIVATTPTSWFPNWTTQCSLNIYKNHPLASKRTEENGQQYKSCSSLCANPNTQPSICRKSINPKSQAYLKYCFNWCPNHIMLLLIFLKTTSV